MTVKENENTLDVIIPSVFISKVDGQKVVHLMNKAAAGSPSEEAVAAPVNPEVYWPSNPLRLMEVTDANNIKESPWPRPGWPPAESLHIRLQPAGFSDPGVAALVSEPQLVPTRVLAGDTACITISNFCLHLCRQAILGAFGMALALGSIVAITALSLFQARGGFNPETRRRWVSTSRGLRYFGSRGPMGHGTITLLEAEALEILSPRCLGTVPFSSRNALCAICLDPIENIFPSPPQIGSHVDCSSPHLALLPCGHVFHGPCSREWLTKFNGTCPLCKLPAVRGLNEALGATPPPRRDVFVSLGWQPLEMVIDNPRAAEQLPLLTVTSGQTQNNTSASISSETSRAACNSYGSERSG